MMSTEPNMWMNALVTSVKIPGEIIISMKMFVRDSHKNETQRS